MDCSAFDFHSQTAGWNAVSIATDYTSYVTQPAALPLRDGMKGDAALRGMVVERINPNRIASQYPGMADVAALATSGKPFLLILDPATNQPLRDSTGKLYVLDAPQKKEKIPGVSSSVSWRAPGGVKLQMGGGPAAFLPALHTAFPEVNVIRLDLNAATLANQARLADWRDFALQAARMGYRLVIQDSDGEMAGGYTRPEIANAGGDLVAPDKIGPPDALSDPNGHWKIDEVRDDWQKMLDWFGLPENAPLYTAVLGWEMINEPRAYPGTPEGAALYSRHIHDLIGALDWGDKRIFVGGMRASAQFAMLDLNEIRQAAGKRLVWSAHMYPQWLVAKTPDPAGKTFADQICQRIGVLNGSGDDIMVTESQIASGPGLLDGGVGGKQAAVAWNFGREVTWFADQGIGWTWWPATGRASAPMKWRGGKTGYEIDLAAAAFAHMAWVADETSVPQSATEFFGTPGNDRILIGSDAGNDHDNVVSGNGIANPHGLAFGMAGDDDLEGGPLPDLLFGGPGNDTLEGGGGDDFLFGGPGDDRLDGGPGNDFLFDMQGNNTLNGGPGNDTLEGSGTLDGGPGDDVLVAAPEGAVLTGGPGRDRFLPSGPGLVTITDFTPGEDTLDLTLVSVGKRLPPVTMQVGPQGLTISRGTDFRVLLAGVTAIGPGDILDPSQPAGAKARDAGAKDGSRPDKGKRRDKGAAPADANGGDAPDGAAQDAPDVTGPDQDGPAEEQ